MGWWGNFGRLFLCSHLATSTRIATATSTEPTTIYLRSPTFLPHASREPFFVFALPQNPDFSPCKPRLTHTPGSQPQKGVTSYALSANRQKPFAGAAHAAIFNTWRRFRGQVFYVAPPFVALYFIVDWAEKR